MSSLDTELHPTLPLVPFGHVHNEEEIPVPTGGVLEGSSFPTDVIRDVYRRSYERRSGEAHDTVRGNFTAGNDNSGWAHDGESLSHYIKLREMEMGDHDLHDRIDLFLKGHYMRGYEIYAHSIIEQSDFFDTTFCQSVLRKIAREHATEQSLELREALPRVSRIVNHEIGKLAVIRSKILIGTLGDHGGTIGLKSRRTGVIAKSDLNPEDWDLVETLERRRVDEKDDAITKGQRQHLRYVLHDNSGLQPVVESLYLMRRQRAKDSASS